MEEIVVAERGKHSVIPGHSGRNVYTGSRSMMSSQTLGNGGKLWNMMKANMAGIDFQRGSVNSLIFTAGSCEGWGVRGVRCSLVKVSIAALAVCEFWSSTVTSGEVQIGF